MRDREIGATIKNLTKKKIELWYEIIEKQHICGWRLHQVLEHKSELADHSIMSASVKDDKRLDPCAYSNFIVILVAL